MGHMSEIIQVGSNSPLRGVPWLSVMTSYVLTHRGLSMCAGSLSSSSGSVISSVIDVHCPVTLLNLPSIFFGMYPCMTAKRLVPPGLRSVSSTSFATAAASCRASTPPRTSFLTAASSLAVRLISASASFAAAVAAACASLGTWLNDGGMDSGAALRPLITFSMRSASEAAPATNRAALAFDSSSCLYRAADPPSALSASGTDAASITNSSVKKRLPPAEPPSRPRSMLSRLAACRASLSDEFSSRRLLAAASCSSRAEARATAPGAFSSRSATMSPISATSYDRFLKTVPLKSISSMPTLGGMPSPLTTSSRDWWTFCALSRRSSISGVTVSLSASTLWNHSNSARREAAFGDSDRGRITDPSTNSETANGRGRRPSCLKSFRVGSGGPAPGRGSPRTAWPPVRRPRPLRPRPRRRRCAGPLWHGCAPG